EGGEVYNRLLANAPYFWQYLMADAAKRFDLEQPSMKAAAVREVMDQVVKITDRVEQLEVAKSVAEGFKLQEGVILERLNVKARTAEVKVSRQSPRAVAARRVGDDEKQLIQALAQDQRMREVLMPFLRDEFWNDTWSGPVLKRLIEGSNSVEIALE